MRRYLTCLAAFGLVLALSSTGRANLVTNGSFETASGLSTQDAATLGSQGFVTLYSPSTAIDGWQVTGDSLDYIGSYWQASDGVRSLDLNGNGQGGITASQIISTVSGQRYSVTFDMAGNPDGLPTTKTLEATAGATSATFTFDTTGKTHAAMGWVSEQFFFTATGSTTSLSFRSLDAGYYGAALDNVSVDAVVPEPASLAMSAMALVAVSGMTLRRRKARA